VDYLAVTDCISFQKTLFRLFCHCYDFGSNEYIRRRIGFGAEGTGAMRKRIRRYGIGNGGAIIGDNELARSRRRPYAGPLNFHRQIRIGSRIGPGAVQGEI
jgi:hypothetical protein